MAAAHEPRYKSATVVAWCGCDWVCHHPYSKTTWGVRCRCGWLCARTLTDKGAARKAWHQHNSEVKALALKRWMRRRAEAETRALGRQMQEVPRGFTDHS